MEKAIAFLVATLCFIPTAWAQYDDYNDPSLPEYAAPPATTPPPEDSFFQSEYDDEYRQRQKKMQSFNFTVLTGAALPTFTSSEMVTCVGDENIACAVENANPNFNVSNTGFAESVDTGASFGVGLRLGYDIYTSRQTPFYIAPEVVLYYTSAAWSNGEESFNARAFEALGDDSSALASTIHTAMFTGGIRLGYRVNDWFSPYLGTGLGYGFIAFDDAPVVQEHFGGFAYGFNLGMDFRVAPFLEVGPQFRWMGWSFESNDSPFGNYGALPVPETGHEGTETFTGDISWMVFDLALKFSI